MKQKRTFRLDEDKLRRVVRQVINEAIDGGWEVDESEVDDAYNLFAQELGNEEANAAIVGCMGDEELAKCLAFLFRQYDFRQWTEFQENRDDEEYDDEDEL